MVILALEDKKKNLFSDMKNGLLNLNKLAFLDFKAIYNEDLNLVNQKSQTFLTESWREATPLI